MLSGFEWISTYNFISMVGEIKANLVSHSKEKQRYLHNTAGQIKDSWIWFSVWGRSSCQDYMCSEWAAFKQTCADVFSLNYLFPRYHLLPFASSTHVPLVNDKKTNRATKQVSCSLQTWQIQDYRKLLTAGFQIRCFVDSKAEHNVLVLVWGKQSFLQVVIKTLLIKEIHKRAAELANSLGI